MITQRYHGMEETLRESVRVRGIRGGSSRVMHWRCHGTGKVSIAQPSLAPGGDEIARF